MIDGCVSLYVFGSWLRSESPNDIDLLWVFDKEKIPTAEVLSHVCMKEEAMARGLSVPIHHTILSVSEELELGFIQETDAVWVGDGVKEIEVLSRQLHELRETCVSTGSL